MLIRVMLLFLIGMAILAMFGKLKLPGLPPSGKKCARCGRPLIGKQGRCDCKDNR